MDPYFEDRIVIIGCIAMLAVLFVGFVAVGNQIIATIGATL